MIPEIVFEIEPSEYVILHGAAPVKAIEIAAVWPSQIVPPPEIVAVGTGSTVTVLIEVAEQLFSV